MAYTGIISGQRGGGNTLAANQKPDIWSTLGLLEPYSTPATQFLFFGSKRQKSVMNKQGKYSWMEDELFPHQAEVAVDVSAGSDEYALTSTNVPLVAIFTVNDLVMLEQTDELMYVSAAAATTATLASPSGATVTTTLTAAGVNGLKILGSFFTEGSAQPVAESTKEIEVTNYLTTMKKTVSTTGRDQAGEAFTDGLSQAEQAQKAMKEMKFQFERLAMISPSSGNASSAGALVQTWGKGLLGMLTTNSQTTTTANLTEALLDTFLAAIGEKGSPNKILYCGSDKYYKIQTLMKAKIVPNLSNAIMTKYGVEVIRYKYGHLSIDVIWNPVLDGKYTDWIIAVDKDKFVGRFMANDLKGSRKFRIERGTETPGTDGTTDLLLSDIGAQYINEETGGVIIEA